MSDDGSSAASTDDVVKLTEALGGIVVAAAQTPQAREVASEVGKAALTLTKLINVGLLPFAAINKGVDAAREYFDNRFEGEMREKLERVEPSLLQQPAPSIVGPVMNQLSMAHDEPPLKQMYLELLARAMDSSRAQEAHPSFAHIIANMTGREALRLGHLMPHGRLPIVQIEVQVREGHGRTAAARHVLNWRKGSDLAFPLYTSTFPQMLDNWERLGLYRVDYAHHIEDEKAYAWVEGRPEYTWASERVRNDPSLLKVLIAKGMIEPTAFGIAFAEAAGVITPEQAAGIRKDCGYAANVLTLPPTSPAGSEQQA